MTDWQMVLTQTGVAIAVVGIVWKMMNTHRNDVAWVNKDLTKVKEDLAAVKKDVEWLVRDFKQRNQ